jgi:hypothetical protein
MALGATLDTSYSPLALVGGALGAFAAYLVALAVYRLFLHPLAKFPGPRLAAATTLYEAWFEIGLKGQYSREIGRLHDVYGTSVGVFGAEEVDREEEFHRMGDDVTCVGRCGYGSVDCGGSRGSLAVYSPWDGYVMSRSGEQTGSHESDKRYG